MLRRDKRFIAESGLRPHEDGRAGRYVRRFCRDMHYQSTLHIISHVIPCDSAGISPRKHDFIDYA